MKKIVIIATLFLINFKLSKAGLSSYVKVTVSSCIALDPDDVKIDVNLMCYHTLDIHAGAIENHFIKGLKTYACNIDSSKEDIRRKFLKFYYTRSDLLNAKVEIGLNEYLYLFFKQEYPCK